MLSWPGDPSPLLPPQLVRRIPFLLFTFAQAKKLRTHNYAAHRVWGPSGKGLCQSCIDHVCGSGNLRTKVLASQGLGLHVQCEGGSLEADFSHNIHTGFPSLKSALPLKAEMLNYFLSDFQVPCGIYLLPDLVSE